MPFHDRLTWTYHYIGTLDRRTREFRNKGWVYVMRNPALRGRVFKVGQTSRWPWERATDLTRSTSTVGEFEVLYFVHASDRKYAERIAHDLLRGSRVSDKKEFFDAPLKAILQALDQAAAAAPILVGRRDPRVLPQPFFSYLMTCPSCGGTTGYRELLINTRVKCAKCGAGL